MTFKKAKKKLRKIADGRYHTIKYELVEHCDGREVAECSLYIDGGVYHKAKTWDLAFSSLENINPDPKESP